MVFFSLHLSTFLLSYKGLKDPIPEEEFEFLGLEDEEEDGANQEKNGAGAEKIEKGGNRNRKNLTPKAQFLQKCRWLLCVGKRWNYFVHHYNLWSV